VLSAAGNRKETILQRSKEAIKILKIKFRYTEKIEKTDKMLHKNRAG
jgi:hypothetical protein